MLWPCGAGTLSVTPVPFVGCRLWTLVFGARRKTNRRTVLLFGENATTPSITAACPCGWSKTTAAPFASRTGWSRESANEPWLQAVWFRLYAPKCGGGLDIDHHSILCRATWPLTTVLLLKIACSSSPGCQRRKMDRSSADQLLLIDWWAWRRSRVTKRRMNLFALFGLASFTFLSVAL